MILLVIQPWRTIAGWLLLLDIAGMLFLGLPPKYGTPVATLLLILHIVGIARGNKRAGHVRRRRTMGVFSLLFLGIAGLLLSFFRKKTPDVAPAPAATAEPKQEWSFRSEAGRWFGHTKTVVFTTVPSGCTHFLLGIGIAAALCAVIAALGILSSQRAKIGWGSLGIAGYLVLVLSIGGLIWGILYGISKGIRRVIYEGGEIERLFSPVRRWLRAHLDPGLTLTQNQANRLLDQMAGEAYREEKEAAGGKVRGWLAGKVKSIVIDRLGCGLIEEASDVDAGGNLRIDPQRLENAGLDQVKHHAARFATSFVDTPRLLTGIVVVLLVALPFVLLAKFA